MHFEKHKATSLRITLLQGNNWSSLKVQSKLDIHSVWAVLSCNIIS